MKQKLHILGIACLLLVFGCKKDKDDEKNLKAQIAGKWKMEKTVIKVYENGELSLDETETEFSNEDYYDFKPDGNLEIYTDGETDNAAYSVNEEGNKVTITAEGETLEFAITRIDESKLYLLYDDTRTENVVELRVTIDLNFTK